VTKSDEEKFNDRAECMVRQYDAIEAVPGVHLNGSSRWARIWLTWAVCGWRGRRGLTRPRSAPRHERHGGWLHAEPAILDRLCEQWCTQTRPERLRTQAQTDPHAPTSTAPTLCYRICRSSPKLQLQEDGGYGESQALSRVVRMQLLATSF